jgi:hypothetical protein
VTADFELAEHELALLRELAFTADACADLEEVVRAEGRMVTDHLGNSRVNPAYVELRQSRILFARLLTALRVPLGEDQGDDARPQSRPGMRGVYGLPRAAS